MWIGKIKDDYYINWKTAQIKKNFYNFPKIWIGKVGDSLPHAA